MDSELGKESFVVAPFLAGSSLIQDAWRELAWKLKCLLIFQTEHITIYNPLSVGWFLQSRGGNLQNSVDPHQIAVLSARDVLTVFISFFPNNHNDSRVPTLIQRSTCANPADSVSSSHQHPQT